MQGEARVLLPNSEPRMMTAADCQRMYRERGEVVRGYPIEEPRTGLSLTFRQAHKRGPARVSACYAFQPTDHVYEDHIFDRKKTQSFADAIQAGQQVLIALNLDLLTREVDFSHLQNNSKIQALDKWKEGHNAGHITYSVSSIQELGSAIQRIRNADPRYNVEKNVFVLHKKGVMAYGDFRRTNIGNPISMLFQDVSTGVSAMRHGRDRMVGFPRLMRFMPHRDTLERAFHGQIRGNVIPARHGSPSYMAEIVFAQEGFKNSDAYEPVRQAFTRAGEDGFVVLASQSVTKHRESAQGNKSLPGLGANWAHVRLPIINPEKQIYGMEAALGLEAV